MTNKSKSLLWLSFFIFSAVVLNQFAMHFSEPREIKISAEQAQAIGQKIWMNEGAGKIENLVFWNENEDFPSLGIGHFIWYPQGVEQRFQETFPDLLAHIAKSHALPQWLADSRHSPWNTRADFLKDQSSPRMTELTDFLQNTISEQTQFIVLRLESTLPTILKQIKNSFARQHVRENFYHVSMQPNGVYALVDYVNFKGEGTSPTERYNNLGWGLAQVLENMKGTANNPLQEFVKSADFVLTRRVEFAPRDERQWLPGWRKRLQTYIEPSLSSE